MDAEFFEQFTKGFIQGDLGRAKLLFPLKGDNKGDNHPSEINYWQRFKTACGQGHLDVVRYLVQYERKKDNFLKKTINVFSNEKKEALSAPH